MTLRHKTTRREFEVVSAYLPHAGHDNDTFTNHIHDIFTHTRTATTFWMGHFNTKLTTDGHTLQHSYNDDAGEDVRLHHITQEHHKPHETSTTTDARS